MAMIAPLALAACAPGPEEQVTASAQATLASPAWTDTSPMSVARKGPTATPLSGGRVLVAGGERVGAVDVGNVFWETAEVFDPQAGGFMSVLTSMAHKRSQHVAVPLSGGRALIIGGGQSPTTAELFANGWAPAPDLAHNRVAAAAAVLADGRVLVAGGDEMPGRTAEIFNPSTKSWSDTGLIKQWWCSHTATLLANGRVLVAGGNACDGGQALSSAEIYNPGTGIWSAAAPMKHARTLHAAAQLSDSQVIVIGGASVNNIDALGEIDSVELYDATEDAWTDLAPLSSPRALHTAIRLDNGAILVAGGADDLSSVLRSAELYDPDAKLWIATTPMSHGRFAHAAAALPGGAVLVTGGENQSSAEIYSPSANGQGCKKGRQCASGFCVEGVCCNNVCSGGCVTCALPGAEGTCSAAAPGTDPQHACGPGGPCDDVCDETGACVDRVGEACGTPACVEGGAKAIVPATCEVRGGDCAAVTVDCAPYRCGMSGSPAAPGCLSRCASIDDCAAGFACDPEGHCRGRPDVAATDEAGCAAAPQPEGPHRAAPWLTAIAIAAGIRRARARRRRS